MNVFDIFNNIFHCRLKPICCFTLNHSKRRVALSPVQLVASVSATLHSVVNLSLFFAIRTSFVGGLCQNRDHLAHHLHVSVSQGTNQQGFVPLTAVPSLWVTPFPSEEVRTKANCWKRRARSRGVSSDSAPRLSHSQSESWQLCKRRYAFFVNTLIKAVWQ